MAGFEPGTKPATAVGSSVPMDIDKPVPDTTKSRPPSSNTKLGKRKADAVSPEPARRASTRIKSISVKGQASDTNPKSNVVRKKNTKVVVHEDYEELYNDLSERYAPYEYTREDMVSIHTLSNGSNPNHLNLAGSCVDRTRRAYSYTI